MIYLTIICIYVYNDIRFMIKISQTTSPSNNYKIIFKCIFDLRLCFEYLHWCEAKQILRGYRMARDLAFSKRSCKINWNYSYAMSRGFMGFPASKWHFYYLWIFIKILVNSRNIVLQIRKLHYFQFLEPYHI